MHVAGIIVPIVFSFIFVLGMIGNTLVLVVLSKTSKKSQKGLNTTNRFIFNLAVADLLFLIFCVPFHAIIYSYPLWPFGSFMCVFCEVCQVTFMLASIYTMVALSLDRYFAIVYATSTKQFRTSTNANICLVGIWLLSIGLGAVASNNRRQYSAADLFPSTKGQVVTQHTDLELEDSALKFCAPNEDARLFRKVYKIVIVVLGYVVPMLFIFLCYLGVIRAMTKNVKNVASLSNKVNRRSSQEAKKRVTKIVMLVVIFFVILWFPHHVKELWANFTTLPDTQATYAFVIIAHCLSYSNSCVNPLIYAFMSKRIRGDLKKFFCCKQFSKTFANVKICSKNFVTYNLDLKRVDSDVANSEHKQKQDSKRMKESRAVTKQPASNQTVVYAQEDSCLTFLTFLTPAPCHKGSRLSTSSSFNLSNKHPACSESIFCQEGAVVDQLQDKATYRNSKTYLSGDIHSQIEEAIPENPLLQDVRFNQKTKKRDKSQEKNSSEINVLMENNNAKTNFNSNSDAEDSSSCIL